MVFILRKNLFTCFLMFLLIIYYSYLNNSINVSERGPGNFIWQIFSNYHLPFLVFFFFFLSIFCPLALLTENMPPIFPFSFKIEVNFTYSEMYRSFKCISSVQSLSCVRLFVTPWITARQASLSITNPEFTQTHVHQVGDAI